MKKIKVFCLPYAGGSKSIYNEWINMYKDVSEIIPVEYSGHGSRFCESLYEDAWKIADDVYNIIVSSKPSDYIIYGHSMGSMIAFLVGYKLENEYKYPPKALMIGGTRPPHLKYKDEQLGGLSKEELIKKLIDFGQLDEEIINETELMDIITDVFKADIIADEKLEAGSMHKINCPVYVATGSEDNEAPIEDMKEWKKYTNGSFSIKSFNDSHFFPFSSNEYPDYFRKTINEIM